MNAWIRDLVNAIRSLRRSPASALVSIGVLSLAIGATVTLWTAVDAVLLRPLPFPDSARLITVFDLQDGQPSTTSPSNFTDYRSQSRSIERLAAYSEGSYALSGRGGVAEQVRGAEVTDDFFAVLGVRAELGRTLAAGDDTERVAVLGHDLWTTRYGADPAIVGKTVTVDGVARTVVGVLDVRQRYPLSSEVWVPLAFDAETLRTQRGAHWLRTVGRLRDGATLAEARAELAAIAGRLETAYPRTNDRVSAGADPLQSRLVSGTRSALLLVLGAVGLALLAACANLASLSLARTVVRGPELALRSSLGARRGELARSLILENVTLALIGAVVGCLLASASIRSLPLWLGEMPRLAEARFGSASTLAAAVLAGFSGLLIGMAPALYALRRDPAEALHAGARSVAGARGAGRVRRLLVVATTTFALVLIAGAALILESYRRVAAEAPGFDPVGRLAFSVALPDASYPTADDNQRFVAALQENLRALPGVEEVTALFGMPLDPQFGYNISVSAIDGRPLQQDADVPSPQIRVVTAGFFRTLGIPIVSGRGFATSDRFGSPGVVVANRSAARLLFRGDTALGHQVEIGTRLGLGRGALAGEIVGVAGDVREQSLDQRPEPTLYFVHDQYPVGFLTFIVRARPERLERLVAPVRTQVAALDPELPIFRVRTLEELLTESLRSRSTLARLLSAFALVAVLLAALGLFGILSQSVVERRRELGLRGALGASPRALGRLVLAQALRLTSVGMILGLAATLAGGRVLRGLLYELAPNDPPTLALAALSLLAVALAAAMLPTMRAAHLDPMTALREE